MKIVSGICSGGLVTACLFSLWLPQNFASLFLQFFLFYTFKLLKNQSLENTKLRAVCLGIHDEYTLKLHIHRISGMVVIHRYTGRVYSRTTYPQSLLGEGQPHASSAVQQHQGGLALKTEGRIKEWTFNFVQQKYTFKLQNIFRCSLQLWKEDVTHRIAQWSGVPFSVPPRWSTMDPLDMK